VKTIPALFGTQAGLVVVHVATSAGAKKQTGQVALPTVLVSRPRLAAAICDLGCRPAHDTQALGENRVQDFAVVPCLVTSALLATSGLRMSVTWPVG